jgi:hypothetical protein
VIACPFYKGVHMKIYSSQSVFIVAVLLSLSACHRGPGSGLTNPQQPGQAAGETVGQAVGVAVGNVAAGTVGVGEGAVGGVVSAFDAPSTRIIRKWEAQTTSDGRTIQVAKEYYVDEAGNILDEVKK